MTRWVVTLVFVWPCIGQSSRAVCSLSPRTWAPPGGPGEAPAQPSPWRALSCEQLLRKVGPAEGSSQLIPACPGLLSAPRVPCRRPMCRWPEGPRSKDSASSWGHTGSRGPAPGPCPALAAAPQQPRQVRMPSSQGTGSSEWKRGCAWRGSHTSRASSSLILVPN